MPCHIMIWIYHKGFNLFRMAPKGYVVFIRTFMPVIKAAE